MIVWGWKVLWKTLWQGTFACPYERQYRSGKLRQARRWFHLYWIPTVPRQILGQVVKCDSCGREFDERILQVAVPGQPARVPVAQTPAAFRAGAGGWQQAA